MLTGVHVLLLLHADSPEEADRAFGFMQPWSPALTPSGVQKQVDRALAIARGVDSGCQNDPIHPVPHDPANNAPIGPDGLCKVCGQPVQVECDCGFRRHRHAKSCPVAA